MSAARLAPRTRRDLLEAVGWILADNPPAARALRDSVAEAAERLGRHPELGAIRTALADPPVRFLVLTGFPYVIVYDSGQKPPLILRVLHGARDLPDLLPDL
ncbi:MAG: type II toxin-antitoxin system RelE/ParE family toxin [Sneathiellaceae bacterium]